MRIGISSPVVTANPGAHSPWEETASVADLVSIARTADRLGFDHLTCSEHVAIPADVAAVRGATYWDPAVTLAHLAAHTTQIRLLTQVLVLAHHHPLQIAKQYGTLDLVSGGRVVLGVGVGSLAEEFALLGSQFQGRGAAADDTMRALRESLGHREPAYHGSHHDFDGLVIEPHAVQSHVRMWVGGRSAVSLRRAVELGDGWLPFGLGAVELADLLGRTDLPDDFDVVLAPGRPLDPIGAPETAVRRLHRVRDAGATILNVTIAAESAGHYCEQLAALAELARD